MWPSPVIGLIYHGTLRCFKFLPQLKLLLVGIKVLIKVQRRTTASVVTLLKLIHRFAVSWVACLSLPFPCASMKGRVRLVS